MGERIKRRLRSEAYWRVACRLPPSFAFRGRYWRKLRAWLIGPLLASCGQEVNIETGARFAPWLVHLGDRSGIGVDCHLHGPVSIGRDVMMGPEVLIFTRSHAISRIDLPMNRQGYGEVRDVVIGDDVWIGQRAIILPGVHIGRGVVVGAGAVVPKDVPDYAVVVGNPARVVNQRTADAEGS